MTKLGNIICPTCNKEKTWQPNNPFRPFCSERCKLIDLGEWASGKYSVPGEEIPQDDFPSEDEKNKI
jgi:uncharacterized protein